MRYDAIQSVPALSLEKLFVYHTAEHCACGSQQTETGIEE
jgi:hypothetical protein